MADFDPVSYMMGQKSAGGGGGSSTLSGLTDVDISNPTDGQTLVYDASAGKWENGAGSGGNRVSITLRNGSEEGSYFIFLSSYIVDGVYIYDVGELEVSTSQTIELDAGPNGVFLPYRVFNGIDGSVMPVLTGDVVMESNGFAITGNCTIQIAAL